MSRRSQRRVLSHRETGRSMPSALPISRRVFVAAILVFAAITGIMAIWEQLFQGPTDRIVSVYRTHGCTCAYAWARSLEAEGFVVRMFEYETLRYVRQSLHTPAHPSGCHLGKFMNYYVEGHVLDKHSRISPKSILLVLE